MDAVAANPWAVTPESITPHLPYLYRYALAHLRDPVLAEEVVQETMVSALQGLGEFQGRSALSSWLTSVLRHKIFDLHRERSRFQPLDERGGAGAEIEGSFDESGRWAEAPADWGDPQEALSRREFLEIFERCKNALPPRLAQAFVLREVMGEDIETVCKQLEVSATNASVMLHRARLRMRECLERKWFST